MIDDYNGPQQAAYLQSINDLTFHCLHQNTLFAHIHDTLIETVRALSQQSGQLNVLSSQAAAAQLASLTKAISRNIQDEQNEIINLIYFAVSGDKQFFKDPNQSQVRALLLNYASLALADIFAQPQFRQDVRFLLTDIVNEFWELHGLADINVFLFFEAKCNSQKTLDFSGKDPTDAQANRLLVFSFIDGLMTQGFQCAASDENVKQVIANLEFIFSVSARELRFLKILQVYMDYVSFFFDQPDPTARARSISDFVDSLLLCFLRKGEGYDPSVNDFAVLYDGFLNENLEHVLIRSNYHRFKLLNLVLLKQLRVQIKITILITSEFEIQLPLLAKKYPVLAKSYVEVKDKQVTVQEFLRLFNFDLSKSTVKSTDKILNRDISLNGNASGAPHVHLNIDKLVPQDPLPEEPAAPEAPQEQKKPDSLLSRLNWDDCSVVQQAHPAELSEFLLAEEGHEYRVSEADFEALKRLCSSKDSAPFPSFSHQIAFSLQKCELSVEVTRAVQSGQDAMTYRIDSQDMNPESFARAVSKCKAENRAMTIVVVQIVFNG